MTSYSAVLYQSGGTQVTLYSRNMQYGNTMWDDQLCNYNEATDTYSHTYDAVGNLLSSGGYEYTWENGRELTSIKYKNDTDSFVDFEYDSSGLRITKTDEQFGTYYYAYDENSNLIFQKNDTYNLAFHYDGNGVRTHFDYMLGDTVFGTYYYRYNLQGDVIALLNTSGTVVAEYFYDPYGNILNIMSDIGEINPFTYRGYYYDWETGFYYINSRYYSPEICRWLTPEPNLYQGDFDGGAGLLAYNTYIYCANNPVAFKDDNGESITAVLIGAAIGAIVGAVAGYGIARYFKVPKGSRWKYVLGGAVIGAVIGGCIGYAVGASAGSGAVLWSGKAQGMDKIAMTFAKKNGLKVLESTMRGRLLNILSKKLPWKVMEPLWKSASTRFLLKYAGKQEFVHVFISASAYESVSSVFKTVELQIIADLGMKIIWHYYK